MANALWSFFHDSLAILIALGLPQCALVTIWQHPAGAHLDSQGHGKDLPVLINRHEVKGVFSLCLFRRSLIGQPVSVWTIEFLFKANVEARSVAPSWESGFLLISVKQNLIPFRSSHLIGNLNLLADVLRRNTFFFFFFQGKRGHSHHFFRLLLLHLSAWILLDIQLPCEC